MARSRSSLPGRPRTLRIRSWVTSRLEEFRSRSSHRDRPRPLRIRSSATSRWAETRNLSQDRLSRANRPAGSSHRAKRRKRPCRRTSRRLSRSRRRGLRFRRRASSSRLLAGKPRRTRPARLGAWGSRMRLRAALSQVPGRRTRPNRDQSPALANRIRRSPRREAGSRIPQRPARSRAPGSPTRPRLGRLPALERGFDQIRNGDGESRSGQEWSARRNWKT